MNVSKLTILSLTLITVGCGKKNSNDDAVSPINVPKNLQGRWLYPCHVPSDSDSPRSSTLHITNSEFKISESYYGSSDTDCTSPFSTESLTYSITSVSANGDSSELTGNFTKASSVLHNPAIVEMANLNRAGKPMIEAGKEFDTTERARAMVPLRYTIKDLIVDGDKLLSNGHNNQPDAIRQ